MPVFKRPLVLLFALMLTACSLVQVGYGQLDRLIAWRLDDYLPMDSAQQAALQPALDRLLDWHCRTQLPAYSAWLRTVDADLRAGADSARVNAHIDQALRFAHDAIREAVREIGPRVAGADADRLAALNARMDKNNREYVADWVKPPRDEILRERESRLRERLEDWIGGLTPQQDALVAEWARDIRSRPEDGLESRRRWQAALAAVLARPVTDAAAFNGALEALFITPEQVWTPGYTLAFEQNRARAAEALAALSASMTDKQRRRLQHEVAAITGDVDQIACRNDAHRIQARS